MLWSYDKKTSTCPKTDGIIDILLKERQELLLLYSRASGISPFEEDALEKLEPLDKTSKDAWQSFVQILTDYLSAGHFEAYENISRDMDKRTKHPEDAKLHQKILTTTNAITQTLDNLKNEKNPKLFRERLSQLGETMAVRFDLEDRLIEKYITITRPSTNKRTSI